MLSKHASAKTGRKLNSKLKAGNLALSPALTLEKYDHDDSGRTRISHVCFQNFIHRRTWYRFGEMAYNVQFNDTKTIGHKVPCTHGSNRRCGSKKHAGRRTRSVTQHAQRLAVRD